MKVRFSRQARADPAEITAVMSKDNPRRAETYTDELEAACTSLSDMPQAFQIFSIEMVRMCAADRMETM